MGLMSGKWIREEKFLWLWLSNGYLIWFKDVFVGFIIFRCFGGKLIMCRFYFYD